MKHANLAFFIPHLGCPNLCSFCNQRQISGAGAPPAPGEVAEVCARFFSFPQKKETEIAFFGGSFTAIPLEIMEPLLQAAFPFVEQGACAGVRVSTRPDAVDEGICRLLRRYGVTSVELGVQSMDDRVLGLNNRGHDSAAVYHAVGLLRQYGFFVGLQIMPGLYGDTEKTIWETACRTADLCPDSVRVYPTVVLEGTELARLYRQGLYRPLELEEAVELSARLLVFFEEECRIPVIRLGLHPSEALERNLVAGPYHPALRELAEGRVFFQRICRMLEENGVPRGRVVVWVNPRDMSRAVGQRRCNILKLAELGWDVRVLPDERQPPGAVHPERESGQKAARQHGKEAGACI